MLVIMFVNFIFLFMKRGKTKATNLIIATNAVNMYFHRHRRHHHIRIFFYVS